MRCTSLRGSPARGNEVVPAARDVGFWVEREDARGNGIAMVMVVEKPAVKGCVAESGLDLVEVGHSGSIIIARAGWPVLGTVCNFWSLYLIKTVEAFEPFWVIIAQGIVHDCTMLVDGPLRQGVEPPISDAYFAGDIRRLAGSFEVSQFRRLLCLCVLFGSGTSGKANFSRSKVQCDCQPDG